MARELPQIIAHIRAVAANPAISTTLIQTEDLLALCESAEGSADIESALKDAVFALDRVRSHDIEPGGRTVEFALERGKKALMRG